MIISSLVHAFPRSWTAMSPIDDDGRRRGERVSTSPCGKIQDWHFQNREMKMFPFDSRFQDVRILHIASRCRQRLCASIDTALITELGTSTTLFALPMFQDFGSIPSDMHPPPS
ncbi:uncharacterized protein PV06_08349 [Exophiala oligosperma]|uniref:Uncharacterized protein n=1 Tax=Exophiala oligosperma TaxID=215243 RepID=A0A0D2DW57_9EURO|nr:uncharacterized protein PV06_08349 [Exophiala oligosperma]KIW39764.1 hypothetical protein PV06_08349 [Exophiala oligosperma]